jgi:hypothetical protein
MDNDSFELFERDNQDIIDIINEYNLDKKSRRQDKVYKRYFLYYVLTNKRFLTLRMAGMFFNKDHSTVSHGLREHEYWWKRKDPRYLKAIHPLPERLLQKSSDVDVYDINVQYVDGEKSKIVITGLFDWRILEKLPECMSRDELITIFKRYGKNERNLYGDDSEGNGTNAT